MAWITWVLFESLLALAAVLGTGLFILLVLWRRSGNPRPLLIGLAVAVILLIVQQLVVTRRERADELLKQVENAVTAERMDWLAAVLAPDFKAFELDRDEFLDYVNSFMQTLDVKWVRRQDLTIEGGTPDRITASAGYWADVTGDQGGTVPSRWRFEFEQTPYGWMIQSITPLKIGPLKDPNWADLTRYR